MRSTKLALFLAIILTSGLAVVAQEVGTTVTGPAALVEIYLAKDDGTGKAGEEATSFVPTDVPIYCVVLLDSGTPTTVKMNLVAVAVPGVRADTKVVSTSYTTKDNQDRVNFTGKPAGPWPTGRYRVDIFVGTAPVVSREFAIQKDIQAKPTNKPAGSKPTGARLAGPVKSAN